VHLKPAIDVRRQLRRDGGMMGSADLGLENRRARGQGKPETFAFLGFTHIFGRTREGRRLIR
jgi:hypothetical protein